MEGSSVLAEDSSFADDVDVIIFATGFDVARAYAMGVNKVVGLQGRNLQEEWGREVKDDGTGGWRGPGRGKGWRQMGAEG